MELPSALLQRKQRIVPVSRSVVTISDRDGFDRCAHLALEWTGQTARQVLSSDLAGRSFEVVGTDLASASALRFDDDTGSVWSAQVSFNGDQSATRRWVTDLFVERRRNGLVRFGAQLNCHVAHDDPGFDHTRPRLIREILERLACEADGEALRNDFTPVLEDDLDSFVDLIYSTNRRLPIVLVSVDDNGSAQVDLDRLAHRISGTAHLRTVDIERSFDLTRAVGKRMSTYNGAVRVYMPSQGSALEDDPFMHPLWLAPQSGWNPRLASTVAERVLPLGFRSLDGDAFWRLSLLRQATSRAEANSQQGTDEEKLRAEIQALRNELEDTRTEAESAEALMNEEAGKYADAQAEIARLQEQNQALRDRLRSSHGGLSVRVEPLSPEEVYEIFDQSPSLETSLRVIANMLSDRVVVLETAFDAASESYGFKHRKKAFDLLWRLGAQYWSELRNGGGDVQARACLGAAYAPREAATISKAGRKRRTFTYKGEEIEMEKHLKIGTADNKADTLRVHFEWIARDEVIVIGHCGAHLDF